MRRSLTRLPAAARATSGPRPRSRAVAACCLVVLAGVAGCVGSGRPAATGRPTAPEAAAPASAGADAHRPGGRAAPVARPAAYDPSRALALPSPSQKVLYRTEGGRGPADLTVLREIDRGTLGVAALCEGPGAVEVHLGAVASFEVACGSGPGVYDEIALTATVRSVPVSVTAAPGDTWALTVGWSSHADPHPAD